MVLGLILRLSFKILNKKMFIAQSKLTKKLIGIQIGNELNFVLKKNMKKVSFKLYGNHIKTYS